MAKSKGRVRFVRKPKDKVPKWKKEALDKHSDTKRKKETPVRCAVTMKKHNGKMIAFWGVFNSKMELIALYKYADESEARKAADDLTEKTKASHFVQQVNIAKKNSF